MSRGLACIHAKIVSPGRTRDNDESDPSIQGMKWRHLISKFHDGGRPRFGVRRGATVSAATIGLIALMTTPAHADNWYPLSASTEAAGATCRVSTWNPDGWMRDSFTHFSCWIRDTGSDGYWGNRAVYVESQIDGFASRKTWNDSGAYTSVSATWNMGNPYKEPIGTIKWRICRDKLAAVDNCSGWAHYYPA